MEQKQIHPLYDSLPTTVLLSCGEYPVVTYFRDWISFFEMLQDERYTPQEKIQCAMHWYMERPPCSTVDAYHGLIKFASCESIPKVGYGGKKSSVISLSYRYDASCIIGDFMRYYSIDLTSADMHWYKFRMLLDALPDESEIKQRIGYRTINLAKIKDSAVRNRIRKIQNAIRIPQKELEAAQIGAAFG